ncbi:MAG: glycosyltransferase [Caldilineaceae bacterium]
MEHYPESPHVVWVSSILPHRTLDAATWLDTTEQLRALGWRVTLIGEGPRDLQHVREIEVLCFPRPKLYLVGRLVYHLYVIAFLLRQWFQIDIIFFDQISAIWLLPLRFLRPLTGRHRPLFIMDTRDLADLAANSWRVRIRLWFFHNVVFALVHRWADGETAITDRMADLVGIPQAKRLGVWPSGVNPTTFAVSQTHRQWPQAGEPIQLIYIGRLLTKRNLLPLGRAVVQANREGIHCILSIYGDGPGRAELADFVSSTAGAVQLLPPVSHEEIPRLLAKAHIGVTSLPNRDDSKYQASSPVKLFEYMAAGMPLLATRNVCHTEVVGDADYAFWADEPTETELLNALRALWQQYQHLDRLGLKAAEQVHAWSWAAAAQKLSNALHLGLNRCNNQSVGATRDQSAYGD